MTLATVRTRLRFGFARSSRPQEHRLRRVALRLAAQTVALLLVMLIVLEVVVYIITQHALIGGLEDTLTNRARQSDPSLCDAYRLPCGSRGFPGPGGGGGQRPPDGGRGGFPTSGSSQGPLVAASGGASDASAVYVDPHLHIVHGDGTLGSVLLDAQSAGQAVLTHTDQCCSTKTYAGTQYLIFSSPLQSNGQVIGAVQTAVSQHQYEQTISSLLQALIVVALLGLLISGGISVVLVRRALAPIQRAVQRQQDFVADAAHELRTPLAIMRTVGEVGLAQASSEDLQATVSQMLGENQHLTRLVDDLSLLARTDSSTVTLERARVNFSSLVKDTSTELGFLAVEQGVELTADVQPDMQVFGDLVRLRQLLLILLDNALKHTPDGGKITVSLSAQNGRAQLQVRDSGPGIDPAALPRVFDRFYRADQARAGEGSGLGLAIGRWIADAHGGQIAASNASQGGAIFTATFPLTRHDTSPAGQ